MLGKCSVNRMQRARPSLQIHSLFLEVADRFSLRIELGHPAVPRCEQKVGDTGRVPNGRA